jgi:Spy/CpxP family protein refolding chaperone
MERFMMTSRTTRWLVATAIATLALPCLTWSQDAGAPRARRERARGGLEQPFLAGGEWWNNPEIVESLALDDATRKKIDDEAFRTQQELIGLRAEVERQQLDLERMIDAEPAPSVDRAEPQIDRFVTARAAVLKSELLLRARIRSLLTAEQRAKLEQYHEQRRQQFRDRVMSAPRQPGSAGTPYGPPPPPPPPQD